MFKKKANKEREEKEREGKKGRDATKRKENSLENHAMYNIM